jgi:hypothetical protein
MISDGALLDNYVASFEKLDDMAAVKEIFPIAWELAVGDADEYGEKRWRPVKVATDSSMLEPIYAQLPARFPRLYEELLLSYRWAEVDLGSYTLLANPLGPDLSRLQDSLYMGPNHLWKALVPAGYVQFAKGPDVDFDPVCFDYSSRRQGGDCIIVKIDHEEILCNNRIKVVAELSHSFRELVEQTIRTAELKIERV